MKAFAVFLLPLLAVALGENVDVGMVGEKFKLGTKGVEFKRLESRVKYGNLFQSFSNLTGNLLTDVIADLYRQVRLNSLLTLNKAESTVEQMLYMIETGSGASTDEYVDQLLKKLNECIEQFLKLQPGKEKPASQVLPSIPPLDAEFHNYVPYHSMEDLFLGLKGVVDTHLSSIRIIYNTIFASGWASARTVLDQLQDQFRSEFLNGYVLRAFGETVNNVNNNATLIRSRVKSKTWREFSTLGSRVKVIFDDVKPPARDMSVFHTESMEVM